MIAQTMNGKANHPIMFMTRENWHKFITKYQKLREFDN